MGGKVSSADLKSKTRPHVIIFSVSLAATLLLGASGSGFSPPNSSRPSESAGTASAPEKCIPAWNTFQGHTKLSSTILTSARASDGFIYLGGSDGLYRLEGGRVRAFKPNILDPQALPGGRVAALADDGKYLWVGTGSGLARYVFASGKFDRIALPGETGRIAVKAIAQTPSGLLIGTDDGAFIVTDRGVVRLNLPGEEPEERFTVNSIAGSGKRAVLATSNGLFERLGDRPITSLASPLNGQNVIEARFGPDNTLWGITADKLFSHTAGQGWLVRPQTEIPGFPQEDLTTFAFDPKGRLWVASRNTLSRARDPHRDFVACRRAINGTDADGDMGVIHLSFALGPYAFAGTSGSGATHAPLADDIRIILTGMPYNPGLPAGNIWNANQLSDGRLVLGMAAGLFIETASQSGAFQPIAASRLGERLIYATMVDRDQIWAGTDRGLYLVSPSGQAREIPLVAASKSSNPFAVYVIRRHKSDVLVGTAAGLYVLDAASLEPRIFFRTNPEITPSGSPVIQSIPGERIWSVDPAGSTVLAAGNTEAMLLDIAKARIVSSTQAATNEGRFVPSRIYAALREDQNTILIGTEGGLISTDPKFSRFEAVTEINAAAIDQVLTLRRDSDRRIWMGAAGNGLFYRGTGERAWQHIGMRDGLITNGVGQLGLNFGLDGAVLLTSGSGAAVISASQFRTNRNEPQRETVVFEAVRGTKLTRRSPRLTVGPEDRDLKLQFAVPEILQAGDHVVEYSFGLEGEQPDVDRLPLGDDLNLVGISPGSYSLSGRVLSAWGETTRPFSYTIVVEPFWWERRTTYLAMIIGLMALGIWGFRVYERARQRRLELLATERRRIAQSLHDNTLQDIFGALLLSRSLTAEGSAQNQGERGEQIASLLASATQSLRRSIDINGVRNEVHDLSSAVRDLRPPAALAQPVDLAFSEAGRPWKLDKHRAYFVLQIITEALNNAAKHACATKVSVGLHWSWKALAVSVADNGKGFDVTKASDAGGFGLVGMKTMAEASRIQLDIRSVAGEGTTIVAIVRRFGFLTRHL